MRVPLIGEQPRYSENVCVPSLQARLIGGRRRCTDLACWPRSVVSLNAKLPCVYIPTSLSRPKLTLEAIISGGEFRRKTVLALKPIEPAELSGPLILPVMKSEPTWQLRKP